MTLDWGEARTVAHAVGRGRLAGSERSALIDAVGRVLAESVDARTDVPGFDASAMDGWVVAGPGPWLVEGEIAVGDPPLPSPVAPGTAHPIATGAAVPPGHASILRREHGEVRNGILSAAADSAPPSRGADIRRRGEEVTQGERILDAGRLLSPPAIALAAVAGLDRLPVRVPPAVDVLVLGREVQAEGMPAPGRVRDAFGPQLPAVLAGLGARASRPVLIADGPDAVRAAIEGATGDLLVTTGGTAEGPTDVMRAMLEGSRLAVDRVAMRPGHPVMLAVRSDGRPVLALPGNPFAALVALLSLAGPLLDGMLGRPLPPLGTAVAAASIPNDRPGMRVVACRRTASGIAPVAVQGAGSVRGAADAEGFAVVPEGGVLAGGQVALLPLPW